MDLQNRLSTRSETDKVRHWWVFLIRGILYIMLSAWIFRTPVRSYVALSFLFSLIVLITGVIELVHVFTNRHIKGKYLRLLVGLVDMVLGITLITHMDVSMRLLPFVIAAFMLFRGISLITFAPAIQGFIWMLGGGLLMVIFAVLRYIINPAFAAITIVGWTAFAFLIAGLFNGLLAFRLRTHKQEV